MKKDSFIESFKKKSKIYPVFKEKPMFVVGIVLMALVGAVFIFSSVDVIDTDAEQQSSLETLSSSSLLRTSELVSLLNRSKSDIELTPAEWVELNSKITLCNQIGTEILNETAVIDCFQEKDYKKAQKCLNNTMYYNETRPTDGVYTCFDLDGRCTCVESFP